MSCTLPKKKNDIKLKTLKCSYNRLLMTIDRPLFHGVPLMSVLRPPSACLLDKYVMASLINRQSDTLIAMISKGVYTAWSNDPWPDSPPPPLQWYNMGYIDHGINMYAVLMISMDNLRTGDILTGGLSGLVQRHIITCVWQIVTLKRNTPGTHYCLVLDCSVAITYSYLDYYMAFVWWLVDDIVLLVFSYYRTFVPYVWVWSIWKLSRLSEYVYYWLSNYSSKVCWLLYMDYLICFVNMVLFHHGDIRCHNCSWINILIYIGELCCTTLVWFFCFHILN